MANGKYFAIREGKVTEFLKKLTIFNTKKPTDHFCFHSKGKYIR